MWVGRGGCLLGVGDALSPRAWLTLTRQASAPGGPTLPVRPSMRAVGIETAGRPVLTSARCLDAKPVRDRGGRPSWDRAVDAPACRMYPLGKGGPGSCRAVTRRACVRLAEPFLWLLRVLERDVG